MLLLVKAVEEAEDPPGVARATQRHAVSEEARERRLVRRRARLAELERLAARLAELEAELAELRRELAVDGFDWADVRARNLGAPA